jgi:hypothetical protein
VVFEPNVGQTAPEVRFVARCRGYTAFLTTDGVTLRGARRGPDGAPALSLRLLGADPAPVWEGCDTLRGRVNYFCGADPARWRAGVQTFARVECRGSYPGVTVLYHATPDRQLEIDFRLEPGASPGVIRLAVAGAPAMELTPDGDLVVRSGGHEVRLRPPAIYQTAGAARTRVAGGYRLSDDGEIRFDVGSYDVERPLVIDPVLVYSTYLGGTDDEIGSTAIASDADGFAYVAGLTESLDFPTANAFQPAAGGSVTDAFVAKLDPTGSALVYSTYLGGSSFDECTAIVVDAAGSVVVAGRTSSEDFPVTAGAAQGTNGGGDMDAFVTRLDPAGSTLVFSTFLGGSNSDIAYDVALDAGGAVYVAGFTRSPDFPTVGPVQPSLAGTRRDAFVTKLAADGQSILFSTYLGGSEDDAGHSIALDDEGSIYVAGYTESPDFPATANAVQPAFGGGTRDAFVAKLSLAGGAPGDDYEVAYCTFLGGSGADGSVFRNALAVDRGEAILVTTSASADFPVVNALQPAFGGFADVVVARLAADGGSLLFSTFLGGPGNDSGDGVVVDEQGNIVVVGFAHAGFPTELPIQASDAGNGAAFVSVLTGDGRLLLFSTFLGGSTTDRATGVAVDPRGRVYVTGWTRSSDFPVTAGVLQPALNGESDVFVAKLIARRPYPYEYAALVVSGVQDDAASRRLGRGAYATTVNVHNPGAEPVVFFKKLALTYPPAEQRPGAIFPIATDRLGPDEALKTDGDELAARLFPGGLPAPVIEGMLVIQSERPLDVTAVYTTNALDAEGLLAGHSSIHVEQIRERVRQADLSLEKVAHVEAQGEFQDDVFLAAIRYTLDVHNHGPFEAQEIEIHDVLVSESPNAQLFLILEPLAFLVPPTVEPTGTFTPVTQTPTQIEIAVSIPELLAGESAHVEFWVVALYTNGLGFVRLTNAATVSHALLDPTPEDNAAEVTTQLWP